jgi:thiol-disulfide isomerase/thioredoxin
MPRRIGPYTIKRKIASGGMGTIFEAVQDQPRRTVAVKVMKRGVASPESLRRFEYESQLLARLRHPGIAQVYEAGTHDDGFGAVPFFAMEYIPNAKPITEYADDKKLGIAQRLGLFAKVCDAVHHGHQKGIIHRDLKPSNILVDSHGHPRIIDFGVARATDSDLALTTFQTEVGQLIGSLQYMSPEQFEADPHDIDTRSDVYALGIVLYELLRGELPYDVARTNVYEAARIAREEEPTRLSAGRPALRGDVETIAQKALEKDRDRRYQSAFGLAQDIRRYISGEAISARPPSIAYQVQVFARRNKTLLGAVGAVFAVLVAGVVVSTALYFQARTERERAELQTAKTQTATDFLKEMLSETIPHGYGDEVTIASLLDLTSERLPDAFKDDPETESEIRRTLAMGYANADRWKESEEHLLAACAIGEEVLGETHPGNLESKSELALLYWITGRNEDFMEIERKILDIQTRTLGREHEATLQSSYDLAGILGELGRLAEAEKLCLQTLESRRRVLGNEHPETLKSGIQQATIRLLRGDSKGAEERSRQLLGICRPTLGEDHRITRSAMSNLAAALITQGNFEGASEIYQNRRIPNNLGIQTRFQGDFEPSEQGAQLLVFWETWCPFSRRALPRLEEFQRRYQDSDFQIVGLTQVNRSATEEKVRDFIDKEKITFPVLKHDGSSLDYFGMRGTPWGAVIKDGMVIWEDVVDTPEVLSGMMLEGLVKSAGG